MNTYVYVCLCVLRLVFELDLVIYDNSNLLIDLIVRVLFSIPDAHTHIYNLTGEGIGDTVRMGEVA